jgi:hypothetical protein
MSMSWVIRCVNSVWRDANMAEDGSRGSGEEGLDIVQPGAVDRCEAEFESFWFGGQIGPGFLGFVSGMIIHQDADQDPFGTGGIHLFEEGDERAAPVPRGNGMVNDAGGQVHRGGKSDRAETLVFIVALHLAAPLLYPFRGRFLLGGSPQGGSRLSHRPAFPFPMLCERLWPGNRRPIGRGRGDGLNPRLFIVRKDRHRPVGLWHLTQHLGGARDVEERTEPVIEERVPFLQIIFDLVGSYRLCVQNLPDGTGRQRRQAPMPGLHSFATSMARQQPKRPKFMWIADILGLETGLTDKPKPGFGCNVRMPDAARQVVKRRRDADLLDPFHTP